jgi:hypothetical protein
LIIICEISYSYYYSQCRYIRRPCIIHYSVVTDRAGRSPPPYLHIPPLCLWLPLRWPPMCDMSSCRDCWAVRRDGSTFAAMTTDLTNLTFVCTPSLFRMLPYRSEGQLNIYTIPIGNIK